MLIANSSLILLVNYRCLLTQTIVQACFTLSNKIKMEELKIGDLTARLPIIQGGMGVCVSMSGLASAVANEGGIGVISAGVIGMSEPDYRKHFRESNKIALRKEIRKARLNTVGIIGANIMMAVSDFDEL